MKRLIIMLGISLALLLALGIVLNLQSTPASAANSVRVWVEFAPGTKAAVQGALVRNGAAFHYTFDELRAFVVSVPEQALIGLQRNPNILSIEEDAPRYLLGQTMPYGIEMVQAPQVWDAMAADGVTGEGKTVCIIDSGLYTGHEDFAGINVLGGYPAGWDTDYCGHGTHVAGTITAANNDLGVVGVAPDGTSLYIVKVFGDDCAWAYSSTLTDAANRCVAAGADIISMSLGGNKSNRLEQRAFDNAYAAGVLSIAAAGNDGTTAVSYPGGYASVISVAAIDEAMLVADFSQKNSTVELAAPGVGVLSTVPFISTNTLTVDGTAYQAAHVEYAAYTNLTSGQLVDGGLCAATGAWSGKVVLCQRGDISFYDKVINVQNSGGVAAVIYNNVPGGFLGTLGEGFSSVIPAISISMEDGLYLVANKLGSVGEVVATPPVTGSGYEAWDGTSMATPHVSGVAALVWSAYPDLSNAELRAALTGTALDLGAAGRDVEYGFGLVQAFAAYASLDDGGGGEPGSLSATVSTNKSSYINRETVAITVSVTDQDGAAVAGASVQAVITGANGSQVTVNGVTNSSGIASLSYKVNSRSLGVGTYTVAVTASMEGYTSASASTSFAVTR